MTAHAVRPAAARGLLLPLGGLALLALGLRIAAADGALWLDEAWSAVLARDAGTPARVFFAISHDNNHYANTLWLQITGWGAPPLLSRALSIASGTASVIVGGLIGARRGRIEALIAAALLAISPILVVYGSEARGYAPMLLALLTAIWLVDRRLFGEPVRRTGRALGIVILLGMLAHLTMAVGLFALTLWAALAYAGRLPLPRAAIATAQLMKVAFLATAAVLAIVTTTALASPSGFQVASYEAFVLPKFLDGLEQMLIYTLGMPMPSGPLLLMATAVLVPLAIWRMPVLRERGPFYLAALFALPLAAILLRLGNSSFPRYHLISVIALLLLLSDVLAHALRKGGWRRIGAILVLAGIAAGSAALDTALIRDRRADPGAAIEAMIARAPHGAEVLIDYPRDTAVLEAAAASARYPLRMTGDACGRARFLFNEQNGAALFPPRPMRCGSAYRAVAGDRADGLSGLEWQLYERETR
jgi:hypothetical protein